MENTDAGSLPQFKEFPKIPRLNRNITVTEKIDGTNGIVHVTECGYVFAGSRNRWLMPGKTDNYGFAAWVEAHKSELATLGPGYHYGEWWGPGIQRGYGVREKRFSLFNTGRWVEYSTANYTWEGTLPTPECCHVVPVLYRGPFNQDLIKRYLEHLVMNGSIASPGFMRPEGIIVYHEAAKQYFKVTVDKDEAPKSVPARKGG